MRKLLTLLIGIGAGIAIAVYFSAREEFEIPAMPHDNTPPTPVPPPPTSAPFG